MPKTRKEKEDSVSVLQKIVKDATNLVFVGFNKLKVADERLLRKNLREVGVSYMVTKKSLLRRAIDGLTELPGQVALAWGPDPIMSAKGIANFAKKHDGLLSILGGVFGGKLVTAEKMQMIASIPGREALLGMLANVLSAPMRGLAISLYALTKKK